MIDQIRPSQVSAWVRQCAQAHPGVTPTVLDVREGWEFQTASIKPDGFELVHMPMSSVPARLNELSRQAPIACLCHHGGRSAQVAYFLKNQGFDHVVNIGGGINAWSNEVDRTVPCY